MNVVYGADSWSVVGKGGGCVGFGGVEGSMLRGNLISKAMCDPQWINHSGATRSKELGPRTCNIGRDGAERT